MAQLPRTVLATTAFKVSVDERFSWSEGKQLAIHVACEPRDGDEVAGLECLRLLPWPSRSSGKLTWHRVAYLYLEQYELVYMLDVLDSHEKAFPTLQDKLDAIKQSVRVSELAVRIVELIVRLFGS